MTTTVPPDVAEDVTADDEQPPEEVAAPKARRRVDLLIPGLVLTVLGLTLVLFFAYALSFSGF